MIPMSVCNHIPLTYFKRYLGCSGETFSEFDNSKGHLPSLNAVKNGINPRAPSDALKIPQYGHSSASITAKRITGERKTEKHQRKTGILSVPRVSNA